ncbi:MFS transporter, partial [Streptomyces sp. NPDC058394]
PKPFMVTGALSSAAGLAWLTQTDVDSTYLGSILGPMLLFALGMGLQFVSLTLMALSNVSDRESGAASGLLNTMQQVGGSLGLSILVTVFGTASRNEAKQQIPEFLSTAGPVQKALFQRTGQLPKPWGDQVLTSGISAAFVVASLFTLVGALIALFVIQVRPSDLARLQGNHKPAADRT